MERARRLANRATLKRLLSEAKQNRKTESTSTTTTTPLPFSLSGSSSRYVSSVSNSILRGRGSKPDNNVSRRVGGFLGVGYPSQSRSISVEALKPSDTFPRRHNSATPDEQTKMAESVGFDTLDSLVDATVPKSIRLKEMKFNKFDGGLTEGQMIEHMKDLASKNKVFKSFIGMGYYNTHVPPVILRNIMENPAWYTQYTPYQAEISQGRLESLLNFQTMITDLTGLPMSNASLLDEGTAAAEAMSMCNNIQKGKKKTFIIASNCHPQTIDICQTRADGFELKVVVKDLKDIDYKSGDVCGVLVQYPGTEGEVLDYGEFIKKAHANEVKVVMASDLLALTVLKPPGEFGADIVVGSAQRFGVPMGYGGPHAAFLATSQEYKRMMPGRIIGVSVDSSGKQALRMAMQTREQHIRRDKATSNICTAQALLANMAAMYAVYHGPEGLKAIAQRVHGLAGVFALGLKKLGLEVQDLGFFDTVKVKTSNAKAIADAAIKSEINLRVVDGNTITAAFDETTTLEDVDKLFKVFSGGKPVSFTAASLAPEFQNAIPSGLVRESPYLTHPIFNTYQTEHELLRYIHRLQSKDLSLCHSMIPLGSCTMKLNATTEMMPVTWPSFTDLHPFAPTEQAQGYQEMFNNLGDLLCTITGFDSFSLQPNAGAAGEYAGLMVIRAYHMEVETTPAYPDICFAIDDFDSTFDAVVLTEKDHCYCVVLNAHDGVAFPSEKVSNDCSTSDNSSPEICTSTTTKKDTKLTLFSGFVSYQMVRDAYDAGKSRFGSLLSGGHYHGKTDRIYMKGPGGRGEVEVAVSGVADQSHLDSEPPSPVISKKGIGLGVIVRRAAMVASVAAKHAYAAASSSSSNFDEMIPLKCSLMSISLPWEYIAYDLLFKGAPPVDM